MENRMTKRERNKDDVSLFRERGRRRDTENKKVREGIEAQAEEHYCKYNGIQHKNSEEKSQLKQKTYYRNRKCES